jgi:glycosyltransferase involved in cell wall biosynthesis
MKALFFLDELIIGGTLVNAIEIAATLRDLYGYDVVLYAGPGPMFRVAEERGVRIILAPSPPLAHPSLKRVRALHELVTVERPDVIWAWDPMPCLDAYCAGHLFKRIPLVMTIMNMDIASHLPRWPVVTFGTPELVDKAKAMGFRRAHLLLPPVDVHLNAPGAVDPEPFRRLWGMAPGDITLVAVSRLVDFLKSEGLFRSIDAVRRLGREFPLRLLIVGDGDARSRLEKLAAETNAELGRPAVVFTGALLDPRAAYAAADIVVGMGGSALRGMAFAKPVIVVGERGFSVPLMPETENFFRYKGLYGIGRQGPHNRPLVDNIRMLVSSPAQLLALGALSLRFVSQHFSLKRISEQVAAIFESAITEQRPLHAIAADTIWSVALYLRYRRFRWRYVSAPSFQVVHRVESV